MSVMTEERIRFIVDSEYELRQALRLYALTIGKSISDVVNDWIREHLAEQVRQVRANPRPANGKKRGRKPKGEK